MFKGMKILIYFMTIVFVGVECVPSICFSTSQSNINVHEITPNLENVFIEIDNNIRDAVNKISFDDGPLDISLNHPAIRVNGTIDNLDIRNLNDINIGFFCNSHGKLEIFNMTFNNISLKGYYDITGNIGDLFDIFGAGNFSLNMIKFSVSMPFEKIIKIDEQCFVLDLLINLVDLQGHLDNFMTDELEDLFNKSLQYIVPKAMVMMWDEIKNGKYAEIEKIITEQMEKHKEIVRLLKDPPKGLHRCFFSSSN